jgi:hypothetical protein
VGGTGRITRFRPPFSSPGCIVHPTTTPADETGRCHAQGAVQAALPPRGWYICGYSPGHVGATVYLCQCKNHTRGDDNGGDDDDGGGTYA